MSRDIIERVAREGSDPSVIRTDARGAALMEAIAPLVASGMLTEDERLMLLVCLQWKKYPVTGEDMLRYQRQQASMPIFLMHCGDPREMKAARVIAEQVGEAIGRGEITTYEQVVAFPGWPSSVRIEQLPDR
jgi:hypothetical protein